MPTKLFHYDGPLGQFMLKVWELLLLNILCILFCIPVITAGASLTALSYVTLRMAEGRETSVFRSFLHSFKQNFLQALGLELLLAASGIFLYLDARYILARLTFSGPLENIADQTRTGTEVIIKAGESAAVGNSISTGFTAVLTALLLMAVLFYLMTVLYVFAVQARFHGTVYTALRNSALISVRHLPVTLFLILADTLFYITAIRYLPWLLLWCCSGPAAFNAHYISRCLNEYQTQK